MSSARERILQKLSKNSGGRNIEQNFNSDIYSFKEDNLIELFISELELVDGKIIIVDSNEDTTDSINNYIIENKLDNIYCNQSDIKLNDKINKIEEFNVDIEVAITGCEFLSARTGTVVVSSHLDGRKINIFAPTHIIVAKEKQIVKDIDIAIKSLQDKYEDLPSSISFITGPSRTADIEKTLILGAHGPKKLIVFIKKD
jgi:L-lactate dehydrogenase complex protein LldG